MEAGETVYFTLKATPFYAVSGGQVADEGTIGNDKFEIAVSEVTKAPNGQNLHKGIVQYGQATVGAEVDASVNKRSIHSLVKEVHDSVYVLTSHFGPMTQEELDQVERRVNEEIWRGIDVRIQEMGIDEAKSMGAMALFGEKYGDIVRVVNMAPFSIELCGGIHVSNTAEIGLFKIVSESGTGAGVRRIEALTGKSAFLYLEDIQSKFNTIKNHVKVKSDEQVVGKVTQLQEEEKSLLKQLEQRNKEITS